MDYIISLSDDYKRGKSITMGFLKKDSAIVFLIHKEYKRQ